MRRGIALAALGAILSWASAVTYFLLFVRWPAWRDAGWPNVVGCLAGVALSAAGVRVCPPRRGPRLGAAGLLLLGAVPAFLLGVYVFYWSYQVPGPAGVVAPGETAPTFRLPDQHGRERSLEEFAGRRILLVFFRGHW